MSDATSLRSLLGGVDGTAPAIEKAAGAMMKHYDRSAGVAVAEWRNALQNAQPHHLLPLLYVVNEVLQTSKRNRGNKFLEAMSPVLGQSLEFICKSDPSLVEKVRRTVKIWADRRVLSIRFVNELLQGLERFRDTSQKNKTLSSRPPTKTASAAPPPSQPVDDDEIQDILNTHDDLNEDDGEQEEEEENHDDDDDDIFANTDNGSSKLKINLGSILQDTTTEGDTSSPRLAKRRRSSMSTDSAGKPRATRRRTISTNHMIELWNQLIDLQQRADTAHRFLERLQKRHSQISHNDLSNNLVGDELQQAMQQNDKALAKHEEEKRNLHAIASERHELEQEALRYLHWLSAAVQQDAEDLQFCDFLEQKILSFRDIHGAAKAARTVRLQEEEKERKLREEQELRQKEREEQEKFRQAALAKETEAKPGMVWNPTTREYQSLNTNEDWRE